MSQKHLSVLLGIIASLFFTIAIAYVVRSLYPMPTAFVIACAEKKQCYEVAYGNQQMLCSGDPCTTKDVTDNLAASQASDVHTERVQIAYAVIVSLLIITAIAFHKQVTIRLLALFTSTFVYFYSLNNHGEKLLWELQRSHSWFQLSVVEKSYAVIWALLFVGIGLFLALQANKLHKST